MAEQDWEQGTPPKPIFEEAGFIIEIPRVIRWKKIPIARNALSREFRDLSDDDLLISGFDIVISQKSDCQ